MTLPNQNYTNYERNSFLNVELALLGSLNLLWQKKYLETKIVNQKLVVQNSPPLIKEDFRSQGGLFRLNFTVRKQKIKDFGLPLANNTSWLMALLP